MRARFKATLLSSIVIALSGCGTNSSRMGEELTHMDPYRHNTDLSWIQPPKELISIAGSFSDYIVENPDRVDRFLGVTPFESAPNHWEQDIHHGSHQMASLTWRQEDEEGRRLKEQVISFDKRGRVTNIDKIGKVSGPIQYQYVGTMRTPIQKKEFTQQGGSITTKYFRDQYGNFMGLSNSKGSGQVQRNLVDYRNIGNKFVITYRSHLPESINSKSAFIGQGEATWRYNLKSTEKYSYPEYVKRTEILKETTKISEKVTDVWRGPLNVKSGGGFEGRISHTTTTKGEIERSIGLRYTNGEITSYSEEKAASVEARVYSHYKHDEKGNWVSRNVTKHITDSPTQTINEIRTFRYR